MLRNALLDVLAIDRPTIGAGALSRRRPSRACLVSQPDHPEYDAQSQQLERDPAAALLSFAEPDHGPIPCKVRGGGDRNGETSNRSAQMATVCDRTRQFSAADVSKPSSLPA